MHALFDKEKSIEKRFIRADLVTPRNHASDQAGFDLGIRAGRRAGKEGINCNLTLLFLCTGTGLCGSRRFL